MAPFRNSVPEDACTVEAGVIHTDNPISGTVQIVNSVVCNTGTFTPVYDTPETITPTEVTYSIIAGGFSGNGNIDFDCPLQIELAGSDSPAIDAGNGDWAQELDKLGNGRIDIIGVIDSGIGSPTYTDIGAIEYQP